MITVDPAAPTPPYEQIRLSVMHEVRTGGLTPGDRLPTVRRLADDLGLAPNTVARAYRELEQDKVIETRGRRGSFVSASGDARQREAVAATGTHVERLRRLGVTYEEAADLLRDAYRALRLT